MVVVPLAALSEIYFTQNRYSDADAILKRIIAIIENKLGKEDPNLISVLQFHASVLKKMGRSREATSEEARAEAIIKKHK